jgi:Xaa-Pro aminopeptidase
MRYPPIPSSLFADRRKDFAKKMVPGSIAIFYSNDPMPRSGDQFFPFRQDSDLFALSGLNQPETILVLFPSADTAAYREIAFILPQDPEHAIWNGDRYTAREAREVSAIETIRTSGQWEKMMPPIIRSATTIYTNHRPKERFDPNLLTQNDRMTATLKQLYPHHTFADAHAILRQIVMVKHRHELALLKEAVRVTEMAFQKVLHALKPGMKEYEVEAELTYVLSRHGCHHAFEPIVASGKNACTLHYIRNDQMIKKDDLVLIDFGAEHAGMNSDMTRTLPASGQFSKRQKDIYYSVLNVLNEVTAIMKPGITLEMLNKETGKLIESELIRLKILTKKDIRNQDKASPLRRRYFMHGVSHHLGYDVHDKYERNVPLKAGMILTCEPGLYIPEEKTGIRLENDILITRGAPKNLMAHIPIDPEEIEEIMQSSAAMRK